MSGRGGQILVHTDNYSFEEGRSSVLSKGCFKQGLVSGKWDWHYIRPGWTSPCHLCSSLCHCKVLIFTDYHHLIYLWILVLTGQYLFAGLCQLWLIYAVIMRGLNKVFLEFTDRPANPPGPYKCKCKHCGDEVSGYKNSTSNLRSHIKVRFYASCNWL